MMSFRGGASPFAWNVMGQALWNSLPSVFPPCRIAKQVVQKAHCPTGGQVTGARTIACAIIFSCFKRFIDCSRSDGRSAKWFTVDAFS